MVSVRKVFSAAVPEKVSASAEESDVWLPVSPKMVIDDTTELVEPSGTLALSVTVIVFVFQPGKGESCEILAVSKVPAITRKGPLLPGALRIGAASITLVSCPVAMEFTEIETVEASCSAEGLLSWKEHVNDVPAAMALRGVMSSSPEDLVHFPSVARVPHPVMGRAVLSEVVDLRSPAIEMAVETPVASAMLGLMVMWMVLGAAAPENSWPIRMVSKAAWQILSTCLFELLALSAIFSALTLLAPTSLNVTSSASRASAGFVSVTWNTYMVPATSDCPAASVKVRVPSVFFHTATLLSNRPTIES
mmetsp:Transcript_48248/g.114808  ORF Transcript_48248/g.114808 Transcript_48248/m.114808 type:complete len:306 (-) Transcript_48248:2047-2964(-)